jgi:hypothetical protein
MNHVRVIREREYQQLLALADPITQKEAEHYSAKLTSRFADKIKDFLWWYN